MTPSEPQFPPLLKGHRGETGADPADLAFAGAAAGRLGAGDLVWSPRHSLASFALVLEPEIEAGEALVMVPLTMVATADALGAIGPPNLALAFGWPASILANGATVGKVAMRFPRSTSRRDIPDFAVLSVELRLAWPDGTDSEPGYMMGETALYEEGCGDLDRTMIVEACARHFLSWLDAWQADGFGAAHERWTARGPGRGERIAFRRDAATLTGEVVGLDEKGGILLKKGSKTELVTLADAWGLPNKS